MTEAKQRADRIAELEQENERLRRTVAEYENCITWDTTCKQCARQLDVSIQEHERADRAENAATELAIEKAHLRSAVAAVRKLLEHAKNVSPSASMTVYVTDVEAALEGER